MTDYTTPARQAQRPWSHTLELGDRVTSNQAAAIDSTRLRDFGLMLIYADDTRTDQVVTRFTPY